MKHRARAVTAVLPCLALLALLTTAVSAGDRPGGGHTYSRGGGGGGGGGGFSGGGGGGDLSGLFELLFWLLFRHPLIGIPLVLIGLWIAYHVMNSSDRVNLDVRGARLRRDALPPLPPSVPPVAAQATSPPLPVLQALDLDRLRERDPDFSAVLFDDFANRLYAAAHGARHSPEALLRLAPYLSPAAREHLAQRRPVGGQVRACVVGAMRSLGAALVPGIQGPRVRLSVACESNLHVDDAFRTVSQYAAETWHFVRDATARTKPWKGARTFDCPNCGAPFASSDNRCAACGQVVDNGMFDWVVESIELTSVEVQPPALGGTAEEQGTDAPTVVDPHRDERWATLVEDDPAVTLEALENRTRVVFMELQAAWAALDLQRVRPFVSDGLCAYLQYWIDAYKVQGLRNVVDGAALDRSELAKVTRDRHFDAVTLRIWGRGRDYTIEIDTSRVVGGDPGHDRRYTEYWTLIRGASVRGEPRAEKVCPSCAAPLSVNMGGNCTYCGSLVTTGDFDWVLSKIEQDDAYTG